MNSFEFNCLCYVAAKRSIFVSFTSMGSRFGECRECTLQKQIRLVYTGFCSFPVVYIEICLFISRPSLFCSTALSRVSFARFCLHR